MDHLPRFSRMHDAGGKYAERLRNGMGCAWSCRIENRESLPPATEPYAVTLDPDTFCVVVPFDLISYQKKHNSKAVKKTLSIPEWLNEAATDRNVNFSQVLQDALIQKLNL